MRKKWLTGILTGILLLNSTMMTEASPYVNRYLGGSYEVLAVDGTKAATSDLLTGQTEIQNIKDMKGIDAIVNDADNIYTYPEYVEDLLLLEEKYAQYLKIKSLTKTIDGREVWQITLGDVNAKNHILVDGAIHGREYHNSLLIMEQLEFFWKIMIKRLIMGKVMENC
ncbi:MAG: M14 family zinc carboxypeptidase [Lachnospiraceae bacterium]|nr:M14 family zinc carboxypeptidase [Lachnospiraceae bacterium]